MLRVGAWFRRARRDGPPAPASRSSLIRWPARPDGRRLRSSTVRADRGVTAASPGSSAPPSLTTPRAPHTRSASPCGEADAERLTGPCFSRHPPYPSPVLDWIRPRCVLAFPCLLLAGAAAGAPRPKRPPTRANRPGMPVAGKYARRLLPDRAGRIDRGSRLSLCAVPCRRSHPLHHPSPDGRSLICLARGAASGRKATSMGYGLGRARRGSGRAIPSRHRKRGPISTLGTLDDKQGGPHHTALLRLRARASAGTIIIVLFTCDEETTGNGAELAPAMSR